MPLTGPVRAAGELFALGLDTVVSTFRRPFQWRELVQQAWFIASVSILPTALVSIPFGAVIALQLGSLAQQLGAQSFTGGASVLAVIREALLGSSEMFTQSLYGALSETDVHESYFRVALLAPLVTRARNSVVRGIWAPACDRCACMYASRLHP